MAAQTETREQEIRKIWRDHALFYKLLGAAVLIGIGALLGRAIYATDEADQAWGYGVNIYTSFISTLVTVLILDELNRRRASQEAETALKEQLAMDAASSVNAIARHALHQLSRRDWLRGDHGALRGRRLADADLSGVDFEGANLRGANLMRANLEDANLSFTDLRGAKLSRANMKADLWLADLQDTLLINVNLEGASLLAANLQGAKLDGASFNTDTHLPDKTYWTPETDMTRFTDPEHPDFWRSDEDWSPAYRGKQA